ncbi:hypothetical protein BCR42DRAFT_475301 [Absidia repens]|uniref:Enoyl reductase (ER) domain-containing protein n=1 Tax=Absidia repens TaxID=90262 RepID=A0A1X2HYQ6_9FUNG|nr:hypothetical protein BCR42DRAFT_475301 [Absidia repens]
MVVNTQIIFSKVPTGDPVIGQDITVKESEFDLDTPLNDGDFIVKNLVLSVDPYIRVRMFDASIKSDTPPHTLNEPITGETIKLIIKSKSSLYPEQSYVYGLGSYEEYTKLNDQVAKASGVVVRNDPKTTGIPLSNYVGILGLPGLTAYVGLYKIGEIKKGETIYVSSASGAVGQVAGQIAKAQGLRVIGSAGSDKKVAYLKEIGFDGAFNYKTEDTDAKLRELCPNGIDVYYEVSFEAFYKRLPVSLNSLVPMLEIVLTHLNKFGRIICCGMVSQYNLTTPEKVGNLMNIVTKRIKFQGFVVFDHTDLEPQFLADVTQMILDKKIKYQETHANGIEKTPQALLDILHGRNFGKQVVDVASL